MKYELELNVGGMVMKCSVTPENASGTPQEDVSPLSIHMWVMVQAMNQVQKWAEEKNLLGIIPSLNDVEQVNLAGNAVVPPQATAPTKSIDTKVIPVLKLAHEFQEGKHVYRVFGGDYTKFGVIAWLDSCVDGVGLFTKELGEHQPDKPMLAVVQMKKDGNPYRVTELRYA